MNILLINWQDRLNPKSGGAEILLHEIYGRLIARGHRVSLLASGWSGAPARAEVDGIDVFRVGKRYTFGLFAPRAGRSILARDRFDLVIESLNKVPTFAPAWSPVPVVLHVHHLFGISAFQEATAPVAAATWLLERPIPRVYQGLPLETVSHSTAEDLAARGLRASDVRVIHPGVDLEFFRPPPAPMRDPEPMFVYVGRLKRYKRVDLVLRAFQKLRGWGVPARLVVAGRGGWEPHLRRLARRLGIAESVDFLGFVSEKEKRALFWRAWANVFVSPKEGWGITNTEAAACGTASVASDSPGLRESVIDGKTGLLVPHGDTTALARALERLAQEPQRVRALGDAALDFAQRFSWDAAADQTESHLLEILEHGRPRRPATLNAAL